MLSNVNRTLGGYGSHLTEGSVPISCLKGSTTYKSWNLSLRIRPYVLISNKIKYIHKYIKKYKFVMVLLCDINLLVYHTIKPIFGLISLFVKWYLIACKIS